MKIAIYSPYLDTAGGGEKYMLTIAEMLCAKNEVEVLLDEHLFSLGVEEVKKRIEKFHGLDLSKVKFVRAPIGVKSNFFERLLFFKKYDFFFSNTDGSISYASAKNNILHFQVPFENSDAKGLWGKIRQNSWKLAICNSDFTRKIIEKTWQIRCKVVYPPVELENFEPVKKKKQIVTVGRYRSEKKQKVLISAFKQMVSDNKDMDWSLHIAGGSMEGDENFVKNLKQLAWSYPVHFYENLKISDLSKLYGESSIYWHAAGFLEEDPKKFEHFGITTVEAMASGCVPVVIKKGGQTEIVQEGRSGLFWEEVAQLIRKTSDLIKNQKLMKKLSKGAVSRSKFFSKEKFKKEIEGLMYAS